MSDWTRSWPLLGGVALGVALLPGCGSDFKGCKGDACTAGSGGTAGSGLTTGETGGSGGTGGDSVSTTGAQGGTGGAGGDGTAGGVGGTGGEAGETGQSGSGGTGGASVSGGGGSSGGSGGGGSGGTGGSTDACGDTCEGDTPVCDEGSATCVECVGNPDCDAGVCDTDANECVECLETSDCTDALCDTDQKLCVECLGNSDCDDPNASLCDSGVCSPCVTNDDCSHLSGATVCDAGECVECTIAEEAKCGGTSCDPATLTCTTTELGSRDLCERCLADSECIGGSQSDPDVRCVPMEFDEEPRDGGFCLRRQSKACTQPFSVPVTVQSLSGAAEESYCGIDQANVTCEAVIDLLSSMTCEADADCGCPRDGDDNCIATGEGGLCRTVGAFDNRCTYSCGVADDCPSSRTCTGGMPYCH